MQVSIIIVSYNTKTLLQKCIESIFQQTKTVTFEIIVVDNASTDGSVEWLRDFGKQSLKGKVGCKGITVIENQLNVGYGTANNQGASQAKGDWLLLLNSDCQLTDKTLERLFEKMKTAQHAETTVLGCQLLNVDGTIQPSAGYFPTLSRVFLQLSFLDDLPGIKTWLKPYQQSDVYFYTEEHHVDWVTGAFVLIPTPLFKTVEGFNESIFMYGEEVDLCFRLKQSKQDKVDIIFTPEAQCYHYKGQSSEDGFRAAVIGEYKGLMTFYTKHFPNSVFLLKWILVLGAVLRLIAFSIIKPKHAQVYARALKNI